MEGWIPERTETDLTKDYLRPVDLSSGARNDVDASRITGHASLDVGNNNLICSGGFRGKIAKQEGGISGARHFDAIEHPMVTEGFCPFRANRKAAGTAFQY